MLTENSPQTSIAKTQELASCFRSLAYSLGLVQHSIDTEYLMDARQATHELISRFEVRLEEQGIDLEYSPYPTIKLDPYWTELREFREDLELTELDEIAESDNPQILEDCDALIRKATETADNLTQHAENLDRFRPLFVGQLWDAQLSVPSRSKISS